MPWPIPPGASVAELRRQFAVEKELADRLKAASREERTELYGMVYDELFRRLPDLPQVRQRQDPAAQAQLVELSRGGCRVLCAGSEVDATLETRWERVTAGLVGQEKAAHG